jgi:predicted RNA-binding Zn ribbon-like protein
MKARWRGAPVAAVGLDLCNTLGPGRDNLSTPSALAHWYVTAGLSVHPPAVCDEDLHQVRRLRDDLRAALVAADAARVAEIATAWLEGAPGCLCVDPTTLEPRFTPRETTPRCLTVPAVLQLLALAREAPQRVRVCAASDCLAIFVDTSRNGSRRWCSMERCGARAKSAAYYRRKRGGR